CAWHFPVDSPLSGTGWVCIGATPTPGPDSGNDCTLVVLDLHRDASPDLVSDVAELASSMAHGSRRERREPRSVLDCALLTCRQCDCERLQDSRTSSGPVAYPGIT